MDSFCSVALQKKFNAYSRMQNLPDLSAHCVQSKQAEKSRPEAEMQRDDDEQHGEEVRSKDSQPAETEYLSARCVLFTYFRGDIGDVVDEHFSRALSQPSAFNNDTKSIRLPSGGLWKGKLCQDDNYITRFYRCFVYNVVLGHTVLIHDFNIHVQNQCYTNGFGSL